MALDNKRAAVVVAIAAAIAVPAEGLRHYAYYDPPGILTVCRGHTGPDVVAGKKYSLAECDKFFTADMRRAIEQVNSCVPGLPDNVLAAFGDAAFNTGQKIACDKQASTAARMLAAGDIIGACNQLPRWNRAKVAGISVELPGLTKRREAERALCLQGVS